MHTWRARTYTHTLFIQRSRWDKPLDRASHMCWVGPSHRNNKSSHSAKTVVGTTQALEATTTVPSVDATSDGQKSGRSAAVAVGTNPCATGEWPSRQDLANRYPGVLVASWSLLLPRHTCHSAAYAVANHFFDSFSNSIWLYGLRPCTFRITWSSHHPHLLGCQSGHTSDRPSEAQATFFRWRGFAALSMGYYHEA
jgi:hypothetical protein